MSLSNVDKAAVKALWAKMSKNLDAIGAEAFGRLLSVYPQTKTYFSDWPDLRPGAASVKNHGKIVIGGIGVAVNNIDDLTNGLKKLSERHAYDLRVDPMNFRLLAQCFIVVAAMYFPKDFTPEVHLSFDKFLAAVTLGLSEKFR